MTLVNREGSFVLCLMLCGYSSKPRKHVFLLQLIVLSVSVKHLRLDACHIIYVSCISRDVVPMFRRNVCHMFSVGFHTQVCH